MQGWLGWLRKSEETSDGAAVTSVSAASIFKPQISVYASSVLFMLSADSMLTGRYSLLMLFVDSMSAVLCCLFSSDESIVIFSTVDR